MVNDLAERLRSAMCPGSERCNVLTCYPDCECGIMEAAAARIEALEEALKDAQGVLMTRNKQIEELRDRLALLNETQSH